MRAKNYFKNLKEGLTAPARSWRLFSLTILISGASFIALVLGSNPQYTIQLLSFDILYLGEALVLLTQNSFKTSGLLGVTLLSLYAVLIGISVTNFYDRARNAGVKNFKQLYGVLPGFLVAGCAGCGVGLLSFFGLAGAVAALPFDGKIIRIGGIALMMAVITYTGDPRTCSIPSS